MLSLPTSASAIECYAIQGKGHHHRPLLGEVSELLLVNAQRETCWARNAGGYGSPYECWEAPPGEWLVMGWHPCDRLPRERAGEFDRVDPEQADLGQLLVLNPEAKAGLLGWHRLESEGC